jgi:hypothetical protein
MWKNKKSEIAKKTPAGDQLFKCVTKANDNPPPPPPTYTHSFTIPWCTIAMSAMYQFGKKKYFDCSKAILKFA